MMDHMQWMGQVQPQVPQTKKIQNYVFSLGDMLGKGNFSKVYRAINQLTGDVVAVKVVELSSMRTPALVQLLYSQIQILKTLKHTNILNCVDVFTSANNCYIIAEVCNDGDLETRLRKSGYIEQQHARKYFFEVYQGLKYLAQQNIVHRDLKVANIFLKNGVAKLADFGFAKRTTEHFKDINIGSPIYMSPEGLLEGIYGPKTDVWAFGVFLYEMTQGDTPLGFCKTEAELKYHITVPLTADRFRRMIPAELKDLILRCLDVNQQRRIGMREIQQHPYLRALSSQYTRQNQFQQNTRNTGSGKSGTQLNRGYSPANSNTSQPLRPQQNRGRSVEPNFDRNHQNHLGQRNKSPPRNAAINSNNVTLNNTSVNQTAVSIPSQSTNQRTSQNSINPLQQPQNGQDILVSKIKFQQCVYILHYCRLIYKCLKQMGNTTTFTTLKEYLTNFLLNALDEIQGKISTYVQFEGSKAAQRQQKMRDVVKQYYQKYNREMKKTHGVEPTLHQLNQLLIQGMRELESQLAKSESNQELTLANYFITILESNRAMQICISTQNYKALSQNVNIESFLNSTTKDSTTFKGQEIRPHLRQLLQ